MTVADYFVDDAHSKPWVQHKNRRATAEWMTEAELRAAILELKQTEQLLDKQVEKHRNGNHGFAFMGALEVLTFAQEMIAPLREDLASRILTYRAGHLVQTVVGDKCGYIGTCDTDDMIALLPCPGADCYSDGAEWVYPELIRLQEQ